MTEDEMLEVAKQVMASPAVNRAQLDDLRDHFALHMGPQIMREMAGMELEAVVTAIFDFAELMAQESMRRKAT